MGHDGNIVGNQIPGFVQQPKRPRGYRQSLTGRPSYTKNGCKHAAFISYYERFSFPTTHH